MTNPLGMLKRSAISETSKESTAVNEITRRLKNMSEEIPKETVEKTLAEYMDNLAGMGYPEWWREKVLSKAMKGYSKVMSLVKDGKTARNRQGKDTKTLRRWKRVLGPCSWFKQTKSKER